jgi:hypothetical protein
MAIASALPRLLKATLPRPQTNDVAATQRRHRR